MRKSVFVAASGGLVALGSVLFAPAASANAPGSPGTPSAPVAVYTENFENGTTDTPILLSDYVGATGVTYSADPAYDGTNCNGAVLDFNSPAADAGIGGCGATTGYVQVRNMAQALGALPGGPADPDENHAVTAYTYHGAEPANAIMFQTSSPIPLATANRFITFSVDTDEASCAQAHAQLTFYLVAGTTETPTSSAPIDPCKSGSGHPGTYVGNSAVLATGGQVGIRLRNGQTQTIGNDLAFDNIRMLDATPQLDASFGPDTIAAGDTSTLTFTITNTSELADKNGWSLSGALPAGVTIAGTATTDCAAGTITAPTGATSVSVTDGDIAAGVASCTVTVPVTAAEGAYTLHPSAVSLVGLDAPASATLTVAAVVGTPMINDSVAGGAALLVLLVGGGLFLIRRRRRTA